MAAKRFAWRSKGLAGLFLGSLLIPGISMSEPLAGGVLAPSPHPVDLDRPILSLAALGYNDGIDFSGYEGRRDLFFHVPAGPWLTGTHLLLPYAASAATDARRTLTVMTGGRVLRQIALGGDGIADIPVPADSIVDGTLRTTLIYSGGESGNRCLDRRIGADHLHLDPGGGLALDIAPGSALPVGVAAALIGRKPAILLPSSPDAAQAGAALTVLAARGGGDLVKAAPAGDAAFVRIGGQADPALRTTDEGRPVLGIGGRDPAAAARAAFAGFDDLLGVPVIPSLAINPHRSAALHLADLGVDPRPAEIADEGGWTMALPASRLPAGKTVRGLLIDVAGVPDGAPRAASVSAWLNGTLLGSAPLSPGGPTRLKVDVPDGLIHTLNGIEVRITRQDHADCGDVPRGWPVQLLPTSEVLLGDAGPVSDFHDFAAVAGQGVTVVVPNAAGLPLAGRVVAGVLGATVPIRVAYGTIPKGGPVLYVGDTAPAGTEPPLHMQNGRAILAATAGQADFDLPEPASMTTVQLLGDGKRPILWVRPGAGGGVPDSVWLDSGDIAFVAPNGRVTALSTHRDRLETITALLPPAPWWMPRGKWLMVLLGIVAGVLIVIWSFRPSVKRAKPGQDA